MTRFWWLIYLLISDSSEFKQNFLNAWTQRNKAIQPSNLSHEGFSGQLGTSIKKKRLDADAWEITEDHSDAVVDSTSQNSRDITQNRGDADVDMLSQNNLTENSYSQKLPTSENLSIVIYIGNQSLNVPVLFRTLTDSALLAQLRMFYRYMKLQRGLVELILPRNLVRIDSVKVSG